MDKLRIEGIPTREEYVQLNVYKWSRSWLLRLFAVAGLFFLGIGVYKFTTNAPDKYSRELSYAITLLVFVPMGLYYRMLKTYNTSFKMPGNAVYEIDEGSVKFMSDAAHFYFRWESLYKIERVKNWILIYENNSHAHILPTNRLTEADFSKLVHYIQSNSRIWRTIAKL